MSEYAARCHRCGRFMRLLGGYSNDHLDSWEPSWKCESKCAKKEELGL